MNREERLIVAEYLTEFPMALTFTGVMYMLRNDNPNIIIGEDFKCLGSEFLADHITRQIHVMRGLVE